MRAILMAVVALACVSAVVQAQKSSHAVVRPTGPMPAVNVP
jgi:hypothetical protein